MHPNTLGHIFAFSSVFIWSSLYICVKILLIFFNPLELLVLQFIIGYTCLTLWNPKILKLTFKQEIWFALAGLSGITIYNLFLNLAMDLSYASNVSVIISTAPLWTGIFAYIFIKEKLSTKFFIAFLLCITGIILLSHNKQGFLLNPLGDTLAFISAFGWGAYALIIAKIMSYNKNIILTTKRIIFYGIIFMLPSFYFLDFNPNFNALLSLKVSFNLFFLSLFASGICFIIWNKATLLIGAIKTNAYVYLTPFITMLIASIFIGEKLSIIAIFGAFLTILSVILMEFKILK